MGWSWSGVSWRWDFWMRCLLLCSCAILIMAEHSEQQPNTVEVMGFQWSDCIGITRNITIYWRMVPKTQETGTVNYTFQVYRNHSLLDIEPYIIRNTWASFGNLNDEESYTFKMNATDEMGNSRGYNEITVPTLKDAVRVRLAVAWKCEDRRYFLNWVLERGSTGYTIYWCTTDDTDDFKGCTGYLNWVRVNETFAGNMLIDVVEDGPLQFFVTANTDNSTDVLTPAIMVNDKIPHNCYRRDMLIVKGGGVRHKRTHHTSYVPVEPYIRRTYYGTS